MIHTNTLEKRWGELDALKGDLVDRCVQYARWTIPGIMPEDRKTTQGHELLNSFVLIGPRLVNNLSNKIVEVMFPQARPFFSVTLSAETKKQIRQEAGDEKLDEIAGDARAESRWLEEYSVSKMNLVAYRPVAVDVAQNMIVTGNAGLRRLPDNTRVCYSIRDYCVKRTLNGAVKEALLRDTVELTDLSPADQALLTERRAMQHTFGANQDIPLTLYTHFIKTGNSWTQTQEVDGVTIGKTMRYTNVTMPFIALTWSLRKGESYGRGLVEEHRVVFHNLDRTGEALFDLFEIAAEIKFLVRPGSLVDVAHMNMSRRGSYHTGGPEDVTAVQVQKYNDLQVITAAVSNMERELSFVFLSGAGTTRDAERVTAVEIQYQALELETAFGGLYSRLALEWQQREADYLILGSNTVTLNGQKFFDVTITTGLESLSREGELENFRRAVADLALLEGVPEDIRVAINPLKVAQFLFGQRGVKFNEFLYTKEEQAANQQAAQAQVQQEQQAGVQAEAAKAAAREM